MHELLLLAQVPPTAHSHVLSILAGIAAMQPQPILERHLVFQPRRTVGREVGPPAEGAGGAGGGAGTFPSTIPGIMQDGDLRRFHAQTNRDTYYVQLVKEIKELGTESVGGESTEARAGRGPEVRVGTGVGEDEMRMNVKVEMETEEKRDDQNPPTTINNNPTATTTTITTSPNFPTSSSPSTPPPATWTLQFRDLPEVSGRRPVISRLIADYPVQTDDPVGFMSGLDYVPTSTSTSTSTFHVSGHRLTHNHTSILLFRLLSSSSPSPSSLSSLSSPPLSSSSSILLDPTGTYTLLLSLRVQDGSKPELMSRGIAELGALKDMLRGVVDLGSAAGERLSFDSRVR